MASEQINQLANPESDPHSMAPLERWGRPLAIATAIVFCISSAFPAVAAFVRDTESWPKWWGVLDVGIAFFLAVLAFLVLGITRGNVNERAEKASYHAYRLLTHGLLAMCVVYMLFGDHIILPNCLTGFTWRAWLLLYILPAWFTALRRSAEISARSSSLERHS
jgi:VIT1/CCC1 family predicted Fe2+/Mn2+ transporter